MADKTKGAVAAFFAGLSLACLAIIAAGGWHREPFLVVYGALFAVAFAAATVKTWTAKP